MGNGSRFPCRAGCVDPEGGRGSRGIVGCRKSRCNGVAWLRGKDAAEGETGRREEDFGRLQGFPKLAAEKSLAGECPVRPYRKPTQVGEARSLRCSSDPWRRNSAK
jgi:hypothetical protein